METSRYWIELARQGHRVLGRGDHGFFILFRTTGSFLHSAKKIEGAHERYRIVLGKTPLVGVETFYPGEAIVTAIVLAILPHILLQGACEPLHSTEMD